MYNFKKGINQWAFPAQMRMENIFKLAKRAEFDGVEVVIAKEGEINLNSTEEDIKKIVELSKSAGVEISSLATGLFWDYSLTSDNSSEREKAKRIVKKMLEVASWLEVDTILIVPGAVDVFFKPGFPVVSYDMVYKRSFQALKELAPIAETYKINIAIENVWNKFLLSPVEMKHFIDSIGSSYVGVYFDVGNVLQIGFPEQWIKILGSRIKKVHVKDFKKSIGTADGFVNLLYGDVNWPDVISALKEIGYNSYIIAELFPPKFYPKSLIFETSISMDKILNRGDK
ncbi:MAG: sugar phosphate isomerase/epimerase family protein [Candidatus Helarchaeota archaeon]